MTIKPEDMQDIDRVARNFRWYGVHTPENRDAMDQLRERFRDIADIVIDATPVGRERSLALTHIEEASMWAIAAIARQGQPGYPPEGVAR